MMILEAGKKYICANGWTFVAAKTSLPYYKFKAQSAKDDEGNQVDCSEVWTESGEAYHHDCGFSVIDEVKE